LKEKVVAPVQKTESTAVGIRHADHVAPSAQMLALTSPISGGRSVGIVHSQTQATELFFYLLLFNVVCSQTKATELATLLFDVPDKNFRV
jgi:hypothetical protein